MPYSAIDINTRRRAAVSVKDCGLARAAEVFGDKWVLQILREAFYGIIRFDDIRADLGIPKSILSSRLKSMTKTGLLVKMAYKEPKKRVRYSYLLSTRGRKAALILIGLMEWGNENLLKTSPKLGIIDKKTKSPLKLGLINNENKPIDIKDLSLEPIKN